MPLIKIEKEIQKEKRNISFEKEVMEDIEMYALLLGKEVADNDTINLIVNEGMKYFLKKDKDFTAYKSDKEKINVKDDSHILISSGTDQA